MSGFICETCGSVNPAADVEVSTLRAENAQLRRELFEARETARDLLSIRPERDQLRKLADAQVSTFEDMRERYDEQVQELGEKLRLMSNAKIVLQETVTALSAQVMRLGQCVECGEMDEQDGIRAAGKFYCVKHEQLVRS